MPDTHSYHKHAGQDWAAPACLRDIVIGMSDGLTVPFAIAAGLSAAVGNNSIVITAGFAVVAAGSIAMGLGGYFAGREAIEHYDVALVRDWHEKDEPEGEKHALRDEFAGLGLSADTKNIIAGEMARDKEEWAEFMTKYGPDLDKPDPRRARNSGFIIGGSYIVGGLIPLSPYFFTGHPVEGLRWSAGITIVCLFVFGYLKAKVMGQAPFEGALRMALIGSAAGAAAFFMAQLFTD